MQTREADLIQAGWTAYARGGAEAGTVIDVAPDALTVRPGIDGAEPVIVPVHLVVEAHDGRVELDMGVEDFGGTSGSGTSAAPSSGPGAPPPVINPEQIRRLAGG
jgi:hypothetical protein